MILQSLAPATNALAATINAAAEAGAYSTTDDAATETGGDTSGDTGTAKADAATTAPDAGENAGEDASGADQVTDGEEGSQEAAAAEDAAADEGEAEAQAQGAYSYNTLDKLTAKGVLSGTVEKNDTEITALTTSNLTKDLKTLSNAAPALYKNARIVASQTGDAIDLSADFNGLGGSDENDAFAGTITADDDTALRIKVSHPLFNGLKVSGERKYLIEWAAGDSQEAVLAKRVFGSDGAAADVTVYGVSGSTEKLTAPIIATLQGNLTAKVTLDKSTMTSVNIASSTSSIGIVAGTVESGTLTIGGLDMSDKTTVTVDASGNASPDQINGNAGMLVGRVADGAGLTIDAAIKAPSGDIKSVTGNDKACAGAIVGKLGGGDGGNATSVVVNKSIDASALTVAGAISGGFVGRADKVSLTFGDGASIAPSSTIKGVNASGGLFGWATLAADLEVTPAHLKIPDGGIGVSGTDAGGLFGVFGSGDGKLMVRGTSKEAPLKLKVTASNVASDSYSKGVGGVIGMLGWTTAAARVDLENVDVELTSNGNSYVGGAVGNCWGSSAVKSDGVSVTAAVSNCTSFGGVAGVTRANSAYAVTVLVNNLKVATAKGKPIVNGGGVVGRANCKTLVRLSGTTDLSDVCYEGSEDSGQITSQTGSLDNKFSGFAGPLVFATGSGNDKDWTFIRGRNKSGEGYPELDDIGGYGEVIRLGGSLSKDFLTVDESGALVVKGPINSAATIKSVEDFARLAITWETNGVFNGVSDAKWSSIGITLANDIDLTGTGIYGLSREGVGGDTPFTGTIDGGGHSITLSIGEAYGTWDGINKVDASDPGNGRIYRHKRLGLFAVGNGSASNLTIDGTINVDTKVDDMAVGAYAATCTSSNNLSFDNVVCKTTMNIKADNKMSVGGFIGKTSASNQLAFTGGSSFAGVINMSNVAQTKTYIGGAIGCIDGDSTPTIAVDNMKLSGSITAKTNNAKLCAGGLIGFIDQAEDGNKTKAVTISGLDLGGLNLDFSAAGNASATGGYLGWTWAQTNVTIEGSGSAYAIKASKATLKTGSAKYVGGLVYHAGGVWRVGSKAINFNNVGIESKATELGLLVCRGGRGKEPGVSNDGEVSGLYLNVTKRWGDAVSFNGISLTGTKPATMDEWVADTRGYSDSNAGDIFASGENGVVSLTTAGGAVAMGENGTRNTYENQTAWGKERQENGNTRYYYNLNKVVGDVEKRPNDTVDTPEELLLWSVRHYADSSLQAEFNKGDAAAETITGTLNMKGYSYYPVDIANCSVSISDATITFWNKQIEMLESGATKNKLTSESSQHQAMHCGLIRNYSSSGNQGGQTLSVKKLALSGAVGPMGTDGGSGALICGTTWGEAAATTTVSLEGITLKNLAVTNFAANKNKSLPLLVNAGGSHLSLSVNDLSCSDYTGGENNAVASSLMGNMGGEDKTGINLSFSNISIPSYADERIFASALLMMSFGYKTDGSGSASYNFTADDKKVTYGQEIDGTKEYGNNDGDMQCWYFDAEHDKDSNLVKDEDHNTIASTDKNNPHFGSQGGLFDPAPYLKYVANGHDDNNPWRHEVAVNHSAAKLIKGCGTYTDPYVISSAKNLRDAANIIQGASASGSEVNITIDQNAACSGESGHGKFVSNGSTWVSGNTSYTTETVSRYLRSAYYVIDGGVTVSTKDFSGLGQTPERAFRGVIVGKNSATLTIKNDKDSKKQFMGLIPYSYGSVVKDLKIRYEGVALSITYAAPKDQTPQVFFGGVMGCVLGGDNIVDGVTVSADKGFAVSAADANKNVPIGGYIGVVAGGGVLFRSMSKNSWHTAGDSLYDNAFLGRMLNGYAFSENCAVDNGERNYKINKINNPGTDKPISTNSLVDTNEKKDAPYSVSVSSAEGLLVLSGIINGGAAAGYGTRAYDGASDDQEGLKLGNALYGKVRNAQYNQVGNKSLGANDSDWLAAKQDDQSAPGDGNTAYLVTTYADANAGNICADNTAYVEFNLNGASFDMTNYSTGYLGLSARYVSNAGIDRSGKSQPARVMPSVAAVKGSEDVSKSATLKVKLDVKEYKTDDFHLLGVGGLFGVANFRTPGKTASGEYSFNPDTYSIISNLTIGESNISLSYVDAAGDNTVPDLSIVGVGGVAGVLAPGDPEFKDSKYMGGQVANFTTSGLMINSPSSAGSLFGYAGAANLSDGGKYLAKKEFELSNMTMRLVNCGFSKLNITADRDAGGFFGYLTTKGGSNSGVWNTEETTYGGNSKIVSTIGSNAVGAGGFVGHAKNCFWINEPTWGEHASAVVSGLVVNNGSSADNAGTGGLIGLFENANSCRINAVTLSSSVSLTGDYRVGGLIGGNYDSSGKAANIIDSVRVDGVKLSANKAYLGGFLGCISKSGPLRVSNSTVAGVVFDARNSGAVVGYSATSGVETSITNCRFENNSINGALSGSLVGYLSGNLFGTNVLIRSNTFGTNAKGLLVGFAIANSNNPTVRIAGLDYQLGKDQADTGLEIASNNPVGGDGKGFLGRSFVAYADYNDKAGNSSVTSGAFDAEAADPYATTSPTSELTVATSDGSSKALFGDSMLPLAAELPSTAETIQKEKTSTKAGKLHYTSAPSVDFSNTVSTMAKNNDGVKLANDFGVLQVSSGNEQVITDYLDTVTNGGYSKAKGLGYVTASATTYAYDDASKQFVAPADGTAAASMKQSLEVTGSGSSLGYSVTSGYDNGLMRITLLTVKIGYAKDSKTGVVNKGYYVLHVPIVVRRMLEVDFTATLTGGTVFNKTAYANLGKDAHVLESYGSSMTGLLTYTYNSAVGERMEYGWDGYLADGGSMGATNKTLVFASSGEANGNYPKGTQLTLLDCANNNKEYHYKVETKGGISSLSLSEFEDAAGNSYKQRWLSDVMDVTAVEDNATGKWVETSDKASATASGIFDGAVAYFRPATKDDTGARYRLTVAKGEDGKEQSPSEDFYLVVRFPKDDQATAAAVVGKLKSNLLFADGTSIATRVNQTLRPKYDNKIVKDDMANSASTYSILTGYKQTLTDNDATAGPSVPTVTDSGHTVQLDVTDTVTFNSNQVYNGENDPLYYELSTTLGQWAAGDKGVGSGGFPSGMSGTVTFYAQVGDTYYVYEGGKWAQDTATNGGVVPSGLSYKWTSDGGEMKLLLRSSNNESDAVSLAGLRDAAKKAGQTSFKIRTQMTIEMTDEAFTKAIAASSSSGADNWTQMVFRGQLATKADQLAYTSLTSKIIGNHKYYREGSAYSTISLTASLPSQLGINIDDLRQATADGTIGTVATYDLSNANNVDELLDKAQSVTFTATLKRRVGTDGGYGDADITKVMSGGNKPRTSSTVLGTAIKGSESYSWTDTKTNGKFSTLNGQKFELPIDFVVDTTKDAQVYANYRIVVTAEIRNANGDDINTPGNTSDFVTFTLTRVNTKGIQ